MELQSTNISLDELVKEWGRGVIQLPPFQRPYVWKIRKTLNLLDSLYRRYPIGAIYLWSPSGKSKLKPKRRRDGKHRSRGTLYVIDGQQRLTSLAAAFGLSEMWDDHNHRTLECCLDLTKDDSQGDGIRLTRLFHSPANKASKGDGDGRSLDDAPTRVPLRDLRPESFLRLVDRKKKQLSDTGKSRAEIEKAAERIVKAHAMLKGTVPVITIREAGDEEVVAMFKRLNGGAGLRKGDIQAADLSRGPSVDVLDAMRCFVGEDDSESLPSRIGFNFSFAFRALVVFHLENAKFKDLKDDWATPRGPQTLKKSWQRAERSLNEVLRFVDRQLGWARRGLLPSANALIPMAVAMDEAGLAMNTRDRLNYTRWLCLTALRGVFRGAVESTINGFIRGIRSKGRPSDRLWLALPKSTRVRIKPAELLAERTPTWGAATQVLLAWLVHENAKDWKDGVALSDLGRDGRDSRVGRLTVHHIFARELAKKRNVPLDSVNCLANYAIVDGDTNTWIGDRPAEEVFTDVLTSPQRKLAMTQLFDDRAVSILKAKGYEEFRQDRARRLATKLNDWLQLDK